MSLLRIFYSRTPKIKDSKGKLVPESITSLEKVILGGLEQSILIRGQKRSNPILLFLHGGPGSTEMALAHVYQKNLEKKFTIVNWDQRGAGKSFKLGIPKTSMTIEQFVTDALELVLLLKKRFNQEKIFIAGHSWGSALGIKLIHRHPEHFYAYVGIGQAVHLAEGERISYEFVLRTAREQNNKKAIKQLERIKEKEIWDSRYTQKQRKWLTKFRGWYYHSTSSWVLLKYYINSPEYSLLDCIKLLLGSLFSLNHMWKSLIEESSFIGRIKEVKVPVFFLAGRFDYNSPSELVVEFYEQLEAPKKELIWFEESAHSPNYEEQEKFDRVMIEKVHLYAN
ncbi:MAG: alpha/beta hydrolase [Asgard group archaeon]|nr:alpha/beta hydrolase [Asgard group archaeon]